MNKAQLISVVEQIKNGDYSNLDQVLKIKYSYEDLIDAVLLPESSRTILWPTINVPSSSNKQIMEYPIFPSTEKAIISFYPGTIENELKVNDKYIQVARNTMYMKSFLVYACSIEINASYITHEANIFKGSLRRIYINPTYELGSDHATCLKFECIKPTLIKITRHIQFVCHSEFNELFERDVYAYNANEMAAYKYFLSVYNNN